VPRPALAAHNDRDGRDRYCDMEKSDRNRQNMMTVLVVLAVL